MLVIMSARYLCCQVIMSVFGAGENEALLAGC